MWPHGLQHTRLPCPSVSPRVCSNSYPLSQWCHPTISSSVTPFFSCPQSFPAAGSFPKNWSFSFSVSPSRVWSSGLILLRLTGLISLLSKELSKVFSRTIILKYRFFIAQPSYPRKKFSHSYPRNLLCLICFTCTLSLNQELLDREAHNLLYIGLHMLKCSRSSLMELTWSGKPEVDL